MIPRMGRPPKPMSEVRKTPLTVRLTVDEKKACAAVAKRAKKALSAWIRDTLMSACRKP